MKDEINRLFPSGEWEGFYLYRSGQDAQRHRMDFRLTFRDGKIKGSGTDDVGTFNWLGNYDPTTYHVSMTKTYATHEVQYEGIADEAGIFGNWKMLFGSGGFHIWPKKQDEIATAAEVAEKKKKLTTTS